MASKTFIVAESLMALCGLVLVVLTLAQWDGDASQVAGLVFAALMFVAGVVAASAGLRQRRQQVRLAAH